MNKKGIARDMVSVPIVIFFFTTLVLILIYLGYNFVTPSLVALNNTGNAEIDAITNNYVADINQSFSNMKIMPTLIILGCMLNIFVSAYFIRSNGVWIIFYIIFAIIGIYLSIPLSNAASDPAYQLLFDTSSFIGLNFIIAFLPLIVTIINLGGLVIVIGSWYLKSPIS